MTEETKRRHRRLARLLTRHDMLAGCRNCGHRVFIILRRVPRNAYGQADGRDVERCERCNLARVA